jgi:hypothetical protein
MALQPALCALEVIIVEAIQPLTLTCLLVEVHGPNQAISRDFVFLERTAVWE